MNEPWPAHIPELYPGVDVESLSCILTPEEFERLQAVPRVRVLPFVADDPESPEHLAGFGLSRLLLRDLMLLPDLSVRGPEDTGRVALDEYDGLPEGTEIAIGGWVRDANEGLEVDVQIRAEGREDENFTVAGDSAAALSQALAEAVASELGLTVEHLARCGWRTGRPSQFKSLIEYAELDESSEAPETREAARRLRARDRSFVLPAYLLSDSDPASRELVFAAMRDDPYDAQLCFLAFCSTWTAVRPQAEALQFIRKAIELSPCHGKAHMCAGHAAAFTVDMLPHYELGYRLLPGNSFATHNLILQLEDRGIPGLKRIAALAREGISHDPENPDGYWDLMRALEGLGDMERALEAGLQLRKLFYPQMRKRTRYCLDQNPRMARDLADGVVDPLPALDARLARLRRQLKR